MLAGTGHDLYSYDWLNESWNDNSDGDNTVWIQEYIDAIGRPIDVRVDFPEIWNIRVHAEKITDPNSTYTSGASFIEYLIYRYGQQAVIDYVCSDNEYNVEWGKSYGELVKDWNRYIEENYS